MKTENTFPLNVSRFERLDLFDRGQLAEDYACQFLEAQGFTIVSRNARSPFGEIDVIARTQDLMIFVEVKYRLDSQYGQPEEFVDKLKQSCIRKTARYYIYRHQPQVRFYRYDIITITSDPGQLQWIPNAFSHEA